MKTFFAFTSGVLFGVGGLIALPFTSKSFRIAMRSYWNESADRLKTSEGRPTKREWDDTKPSLVAIQWTGENFEKVQRFVNKGPNSTGFTISSQDSSVGRIARRAGVMVRWEDVPLNSYIARENDEFIVYPAGVFHATFIVKPKDG